MLLDAVEISSVEEESLADIAQEQSETRLVYEHKYGVVELHLDNLSCLNTGTYLKDTIIQFYTAYLLNQVVDETIASKLHIFDSIFYDQLAKVFGDPKIIDASKFYQLGRWYSNTDIFAKDFLIFPICLNDHWFVIIVCNPAAVSEFGSHGEDASIEEDGKRLSKKPGIMILDSLGVQNPRATMIVRDFLDYEWRFRSSKFKRFGHLDLPDYFPPLPLQKNCYDCGLFMLMYIKTFLENPRHFYRLVAQEDDASDNNLAVMIEKNLEANGRKRIKALVGELCKQNEEGSKT